MCNVRIACRILWPTILYTYGSAALWLVHWFSIVSIRWNIWSRWIVVKSLMPKPVSQYSWFQSNYLFHMELLCSSVTIHSISSSICIVFFSDNGLAFLNSFSFRHPATRQAISDRMCVSIWTEVCVCRSMIALIPKLHLLSQYCLLVILTLSAPNTVVNISGCSIVLTVYSLADGRLYC